MGANFPHATSARSSTYGIFDGGAPSSASLLPSTGALPLERGESAGSLRCSAQHLHSGGGIPGYVGGLITDSGISEFSAPLGGRSKRVLDVMVATIMLMLAWPLMLVVAALIKISSPGRVLFVHRRIGFNGRSFNCYKFRTMVETAETSLETYLAGNPQAAKEWQAAQKLRWDPRVTFLGRMFRKSSLDELPQLFNVLSGEMSLVGPRPIVAEELRRYGRSANEYLMTRPGLTGLWQINGRDSVDYSRRVSFDVEYVRTWSLFGDLAILVHTIGAVMRFDQAS